MTKQHLMRLAATLAVAIGGCSSGSNPPVEILYADVGKIVKSPSGEIRSVSTGDLKLSAGDDYVWRMFIRTNKPTVEVTQEVTMAGPAEWGSQDDPAANERYRISSDRRTATVTDQMNAADGMLFGAWGITETDPPGPVTVKVTIDGKVERAFSLEVKGRTKE